MKSILVALTVLSISLVLHAEPYPAASIAADAPATVTFADFEAQFELDPTKFEIRGGFTLGEKSNGINLFKEDVEFEIGSFAKTIPAGSFKEVKRGKIRYTETTDEFTGDVTVRIIGNSTFSLKIEGVSKFVTKSVRAEDITLKIGDDEGRARQRIKPEQPEPTN